MRNECVWTTLILRLVLATAQPAASQQLTVDPWPAVLAAIRTARPSSNFEYNDFEVPRDPSIRTKCLAARFCECTISEGYNRTFWLNTASTVFNGQVYLAILHRVVSLKTTAHYRQTNTTMRNQVFEVNSLLFCKASITNDSLQLKQEDCKLVEPGPGYREKHPFPPRGVQFELNGLIDPRLITGGDSGGLFLQAGCRPMHLSTMNGTKFREGMCLVKLLDGISGAGKRQLEETARDGSAAIAAPGLPLPRITISSADWPVGRLMSITHESGIGSWEKSWSPFNYKGTVLWSRNLKPHQVVTVHANGVASTLYRVENEEVFKPLASVCGSGPRGNTPAVLVSASQSGLPRDMYLNILHYTPHRGGYLTPDNRNCHEYLNYFYLMDSEPPFNIMEVARTHIPLLASTNPVLDQPPLVFGMGYISFPTGMFIQDDRVVITYGSGDSQLRVFNAALKDVLGTFTHTWITNPPKSTLIQGRLER